MSFIIENGVLENYIPSGETDIVIPEGVTSIKKLVFYGLECQRIKSITLPRSLTVIERCAFDCCRYLQSVEIPDSVTRIEDYAFNECGINSITIPGSVTSIGNHAFSWCKNLQSITIPGSVTSIGDHAFSRCKKLRSITIPESVTSIGNYAFSDCGLQSITIPDSITHIGYGAFSNIKIMFRSKGFQVSFFLKEWGLNVDGKNLMRFYENPTADNFKKIKQTCYKYPMALLRFFGHYEEKYRKYIKRKVIKISRSLIDENNYELMNMVLAAGFVTKYGIDKLIDYSFERGQTEMTALLLNHKSKHFGFTDINKRFRL